MNRITFEVGTFEVNCSIIFENGKALVVDPGAEATRIRAELKKLDLDLAAVLLTHAHFDHIGAIPELQRAFPGLPVFISDADAKIISHPFNQFPPDYPLVEGLKGIKDAKDLKDFLASIGWETSVEVIDTPGHTPGGVCYLFSAPSTSAAGAQAPSTLFSGDTLFCCSVGRTDFPGGDMATLQESLEKLKVLPGDTVVVPGHGVETTIARELASNPFLQ
jgi:glyoxylase-like metal-dependent hydrolase (beta-lactamase superfamily II)